MAGGQRIIDIRLGPDHCGWRLDRALAAAVPTLSRERIKALISSGAVEGPAGLVRDPSARAASGGYRLNVPEPKPAHNVAQ